MQTRIFVLILQLYLVQNVYCSVAQKLYFYGQPALTTETGFIKIDPKTMAWEPAAEGFATMYPSSHEAIQGLIFNSNQNYSFIYGAFSLWNGSYVGCILRMDPQTLDLSQFNSGILGDRLDSAVFFNNDNEIAMMGAMVGFQQNPGVNLNQVGACLTDGSSCCKIGNGIKDYGGTGKILSLHEMLYIIYQTNSFDVRVVAFNTTLKETDHDWFIIYETNRTEYHDITMETYMDSLWLFGWVPAPNNRTVSAAKWNFDENSWDFYNSDPPASDNYLGYQIIVSVSPNGDSAYLLIAEAATVYLWNNNPGYWEFYANTSCSNSISMAALNDGVLVGCISRIYKTTPDSSKALDDLFCDGTWDHLTMTSATRLYAICHNDSLISVLYNLPQQQVMEDGIIDNLEQLVVKLQSMCIYGQKMFISGIFQKVGNISAYRVAVWDQNEVRWYSVFNTKMTTCYCATDGSLMTAVCTQQSRNAPPVMLRDWADSDSGNLTVISNTEIFNLTQLANFSYVSDIYMLDEIVYIVSSNGLKNLTLSKWSETEGLQFITFGTGTYWGDVLVRDNIAFLTGRFWIVNSSLPLSSARYNLLNNTWMDMEQLLQIDSQETNLGLVGDLIYYDTLDTVYACGEFNRAGNTRVGNIAGFNSDGEAVDSLSGGVPDWVYSVQPVSYRLYVLTRRPDCPTSVQNSCGVLLYYDTLLFTYSYGITQGVGIIAAGDLEAPDSSDESDKFLDHWWGRAIVVVMAAFVIFSLTFLGVFVVRKVWRGKRAQYEEIPDLQPNLLASADSPDVIDFQTENFVMKSVLGRGAYGTVWSCVFPHRGRTYAVKQMLFSKGDVKQIEIVRKEIEILEKFRHPHIVHYCGYRVDERPSSIEFFIFMELYEQPCSLKGVIQKRQKKIEKKDKPEWFTYDEVKNYLFQIADGLNYLHINGVAHRDLKCANILVRTKGSVVHSLHIADFGISRVMLSEEGNVNVLASTVLGTPSFMAPEIFKNQPYDAFKADIWSFGMLIYEMLSWQEPATPGKKPEFPEEVQQALNKDHRFQSVLEIFEKCAQQEPNNRPSSADLLFFCENLP